MTKSPVVSFGTTLAILTKCQANQFFASVESGWSVASNWFVLVRFWCCFGEGIKPGLFVAGCGDRFFEVFRMLLQVRLCCCSC